MSNTIRVSAEVYMRIIAGKPVKHLPPEPMLNKEYKIINRATETHMRRYLYAVLGDYSYWRK